MLFCLTTSYLLLYARYERGKAFWEQHQRVLSPLPMRDRERIRLADLSLRPVLHQQKAVAK